MSDEPRRMTAKRLADAVDRLALDLAEVRIKLRSLGFHTGAGLTSRGGAEHPFCLAHDRVVECVDCVADLATMLRLGRLPVTHFGVAEDGAPAPILDAIEAAPWAGAEEETPSKPVEIVPADPVTKARRKARKAKPAEETDPHDEGPEIDAARASQAKPLPGQTTFIEEEAKPALKFRCAHCLTSWPIAAASDLPGICAACRPGNYPIWRNMAGNELANLDAADEEAATMPTMMAWRAAFNNGESPREAAKNFYTQGRKRAARKHKKEGALAS